MAIGDEGFYNEANGPNYPYQGSEGVDFDANLAIKTLDFGTFHVSDFELTCGICSSYLLVAVLSS